MRRTNTPGARKESRRERVSYRQREGSPKLSPGLLLAKKKRKRGKSKRGQTT